MRIENGVDEDPKKKGVCMVIRALLHLSPCMVSLSPDVPLFAPGHSSRPIAPCMPAFYLLTATQSTGEESSRRGEERCKDSETLGKRMDTWGGVETRSQLEERQRKEERH